MVINKMRGLKKTHTVGVVQSPELLQIVNASALLRFFMCALDNRL